MQLLDTVASLDLRAHSTVLEVMALVKPNLPKNIGIFYESFGGSIIISSHGDDLDSTMPDSLYLACGGPEYGWEIQDQSIDGESEPLASIGGEADFWAVPAEVVAAWYLYVLGQYLLKRGIV